MSMKANADYGGGKKGGNMHEGLKTHSPSVNDESRKPIGSKYPSVDSGATRDGPAATSPTIGPRTA